jgi:hypothetical protein
VYGDPLWYQGSCIGIKDLPKMGLEILNDIAFIYERHNSVVGWYREGFHTIFGLHGFGVGKMMIALTAQSVTRWKTSATFRDKVDGR